MQTPGRMRAEVGNSSKELDYKFNGDDTRAERATSWSHLSPHAYIPENGKPADRARYLPPGILDYFYELFRLNFHFFLPLK